MSKISAIILTKNEEGMIADCIDSLSFCDEILLIDNSSTDRTIDIAERMGAKVYQSDAVSFAERRNYGLKKAKHEWIMYVDADERLDGELQCNVKCQISNVKCQMDHIHNTSDAVAFRVNRKNFYLGNHEWPKIEKLERLFKKDHLKEWYGDLHETARIAGEIGDLDGFLLHYTHRDLTSMLQKTITWSAIEAQLRYDSGHPKMTWWRFPRVMFTAFYDSYVKQEGYKVGVAGLVESMYQAFSMFITYARLWEKQQSKK
jgi:hypothetical protein